MSRMSNPNNESITLSLDDSFFIEKGKDTTVEEYFRNIDERVNAKIAQGMKQAMLLIIKKLDVLIQNRLKCMVKDEVKVCAATNYQSFFIIIHRLLRMNERLFQFL